MEYSYLEEENIYENLRQLVDWSQQIGKEVSLEKEHSHSLEFLESIAELEVNKYLEPIEVDFFIEFGLDPLLSRFIDICDGEDEEKGFKFLEEAGIKNFKELSEKEDSLRTFLDKVKRIVNVDDFSYGYFLDNIAISIGYKFKPTEKIHELVSSLITKYQNNDIETRSQENNEIPVSIQEKILLKEIKKAPKIEIGIPVFIKPEKLKKISGFDLDMTLILFVYKYDLQDVDEFFYKKDIKIVLTSKLIDALKELDTSDLDKYIKKNKVTEPLKGRISFNGLSLVIDKTSINISGKSQKDILSLMFNSEEPLEAWYFSEMINSYDDFRDRNKEQLRNAMRRLNAKAKDKYMLEELFLVTSEAIQINPLHDLST